MGSGGSRRAGMAVEDPAVEGAEGSGGFGKAPPVNNDEDEMNRAPFRFEARRARMDWRLLHAVDVDRMMRENDLDVLESTLAGGGDARPPPNFDPSHPSTND